MPTSLFEPGAADVLYIVDVSGYVFRAYHAVAPLTSPSGEPTHAVFGTVNMLERMMRQCRPHRLAVAMDSRTRTFRKDLYPQYKANRPPPPEDLKVQMGRVGEIIDAFGIQVIQQDGVEADDLIASAVDDARKHGLRVVIVSADKDLMQLVGDDVLMWDTMRDRVYGREEVQERFGVRIDQVRDLLALTGDSSDNVPGVPSVGPKTAKTLLDEYDSLDGIYAHLDEIQRKKLRETLAEHRDGAFLSRDLVTLRKGCNTSPGDDPWVFSGRDTARLRELYTDLGFTRHLAGLEREGTARSSTPSAGREVAKAPERLGPARVHVVTSKQDLDALAASARRSKTLAIDVSSAGADPMRSDIVGLGLCTERSDCHYVPVAHRYVGAPTQLTWDDVAASIGPLLEDEAIEKRAHDVKSVRILLAQRDVSLRGAGFDSLLASYLLDPSAAHDLERVARAHLDVALSDVESLTKTGRKRIGIDEVEVEPAALCFARRAHACLALRSRMEQKLEEEGLKKLMWEVELPLAGLLADIEQNGICLDEAHLHELGERITVQLAELEKRAHVAAGKEFNVNSPRQLETLLFDDLKLKPLKRTKTSRSTDAATLEALADEHPLPALILDIRQLAKLKGTYIDALPGLVNPSTGRLHTRWGQAVAATGRLSSHDPNLQNIPIRSEVGRSIRDAFRAPEGFQLVSADYSQVELRVLAHLSEDPVLLDAFRSGQDIHLRTAMEIFDVEESGVDAELRRRAKAVNFGVVYGQGDSGLAKSLGIERAEAGAFIAAYFRRYAGVRTFMDATLEAARAAGCVRSALGRRRLLPDIRSSNRARRLAAERIAMNMPIQGTAADILKLAMLRLAEPVAPGARMLLTVHDELVFEVPNEHVERASDNIRRGMQEAYPLAVPLVVDVGHGTTWSRAH